MTVTSWPPGGQIEKIASAFRTLTRSGEGKGAGCLQRRWIPAFAGMTGVSFVFYMTGY